MSLSLMSLSWQQQATAAATPPSWSEPSIGRVISGRHLCDAPRCWWAGGLRPSTKSDVRRRAGGAPEGVAGQGRRLAAGAEDERVILIGRRRWAPGGTDKQAGSVWHLQLMRKSAMTGPGNDVADRIMVCPYLVHPPTDPPLSEEVLAVVVLVVRGVRGGGQ